VGRSRRSTAGTNQRGEVGRVYLDEPRPNAIGGQSTGGDVTPDGARVNTEIIGGLSQAD
jgi:hypothetical protein